MASPSGTQSSTGNGVRESVVIRFAGDSGDGMQLTGTQFMQETALAGSDLATFPDYPAEIRAPAGTTFGVSAFQIQFGADVMTPGDALDVLVAMNPAALKVTLKDLRMGGTVVIDTSAFSARNLQKAGYDENPLENNTLAPYLVLKIDITRHTLGAVEGLGLSQKEALRCRNLWALGLILWMYGRKRQATVSWIEQKFADRPKLAEANVAALNAGHSFGETAEMPAHGTRFTVAEGDLAPGVYRTVSGTEALAWGLLAGLRASGIKRLVFGSYPITPASPLLHVLARFRERGVVTFQAEDEIAAVCSAIGASYAGALGVTSSSGPGIALKGEALGLAIGAELPLVVVNSQRAGPSTGLPTKTEQSDLFQALYGRNGDAPMPVVAAATPSGCFETAIEAVRLAVKYMTPVMLLTDGYLANAAEPWLIPDADSIEPFPVSYHAETEGFHPFIRNPETMARAWPVPGTPGLEHRIGGLEKHFDTGHISYDADNHERMTQVRAGKVNGIANDIPLQDVAVGEPGARLAVVGWGSTYGAIHQAVKRLRADGLDAAHVHLRYLHPFPRNLGELLGGFGRVLVAEMNNGQLVHVLRAAYLLGAEGLSNVTGKPFKVAEIVDAVRSRMES